MECEIPVSLLSPDMVISGVIPALLALGAGVMVCLFTRLPRRRKLIVLAVTGLLSLAGVASTVMLASRSQVQVRDGVLHVRAGFWRAQAPLADVQFDPVPTRRLPRRTNGMSADGVRAGWFEAVDGTRTFALARGEDRMTLRSGAGFDITLDPDTYRRLRDCLQADDPD
ncbi:hypothetical protein RZA67_14905 [Stenotrophomonas sp. C3(2023)]|uniref:hypothetical protein n=1 Tax=Stenotrophomonas sp. C3(2023) TaxID=3080277 RepID=UPI00293CCEA6|nr:hypothetical protein [Stenotrophomonas sp. C3(2023)]MDV3470011.1 hypothetical protein [Stenotrophomonas sp. C3(2023)]